VYRISRDDLEQSPFVSVALVKPRFVAVLQTRISRQGSNRMEGVKIRLRLAGRRGYEPPVSLSLGDQLPHIGDVIDVPLADRRVRAQVTATSAPICRGPIVMYIVFANEPEP